MGRSEDGMIQKKKTLPSRQARGSARKSNIILSQDEICVALLFALFLFALLVAPHLIYDYVAPLKGWC